MDSAEIRLAILASGSGTNAENLARHFQGHDQIQVCKILSNREGAYVLQRADKLGIRSSTFTREEFRNQSFLKRLENIDYLILAGFLWLVPEFLIEAFSDKIINIHPALLPAYGGKGMYGSRVHEAVIEAGENESGITIHLVNKEYDKGKILFQARCTIDQSDTPETLAQKVHALEYEFFPRIVEEYVLRS